MKLAALIPAKVHSRRLPNKNYRMFFGKQMYQWVIKEAQKAEIFEQIFLSAEAHRPFYLNNDNVKVEEVLKYYLEEGIIEAAYVCILYPCAYGITQKHLLESYKKLLSEKRDYCYSYGMMNGDYPLDNGGFYWLNTEAFLRDNICIGENALKYEAPQIDINTLEDFMEAKLDAMARFPERFKA